MRRSSKKTGFVVPFANVSVQGTINVRNTKNEAIPHQPGDVISFTNEETSSVKILSQETPDSSSADLEKNITPPASTTSCLPLFHTARTFKNHDREKEFLSQSDFVNPIKKRKVCRQDDEAQPDQSSAENHDQNSACSQDSENQLSAEEISRMNNTGTNMVSGETKYFNVVWCKRSMKKRKTWEGDGILIVKSRSAVLKNMEGKEIASGLGYKAKEVSQLDEGRKFLIGGKECEIQQWISEKEYQSGKCFQTQSDEPVVLNQFVFKKFRCPFTDVPPKNEVEEVPRLPRDPKYFYMPDPSAYHQHHYNTQKLPIVDVKVDNHIGQHLRPHQQEGVTFMYECIMGFKNYLGAGVILGDEMGLGKTLQCITLIWTLFKQGPYGGLPVLKKVLIITPSSLVKNWEAEFFKWLGRERITVFAVGPKKKVNEFVNSRYAVLIVSYEMYVRSVEVLKPVSFDLVICDEGHRLKNVNIKTSEVIMRMPTKRRILLTGTPIQNDLEEFYSIVEFANPGILGTISSFRKIYQNPIVKSHNPYCTEEEKQIGNLRAVELTNKTKLFFLRRGQDVINKYLPPKFEFVVFCRPREIQCSLYKHLLQSKDLQTCLLFENGPKGPGGTVHLQYISALRKLCNHPVLLHTVETNSNEEGDGLQNSVLEYMKSGFPEGYIFQFEQSGKMSVLENLLKDTLSNSRKDKIVIVSNFTQTLNIIGDLCKKHSYESLRLDGSTNSALRLELVEKFNASYTKFRVFLLSSKAGGVGLNLIGASRIILYDIDWNPATDLQAMARVWRDGQKKPVYVYRLLTTGTIEEKIYQRQVAKQGLSGTVIDSAIAFKSQFSYEDLKDIFRFHYGVECLTHDSIECACLGVKPVSHDIGFCTAAGKKINDLEAEEKENIVHPVQQTATVKGKSNTTMAELLKWKHIPHPFTSIDILNSSLEKCTEDVTFLFANSVNYNCPTRESSETCNSSAS